MKRHKKSAASTSLTPEQEAIAERIYQRIRERTDAGIREMARMLAGKPDDGLFGATEYELRDRALAVGAVVLEEAAQEAAKKGGT
jgi:hypothetical protein